MSDLAHHRFLRVLLLRGNQITKLQGVSSLQYLETLDVSNNKISDIEGLQYDGAKTGKGTGLPQLHTLDLSGNSIQKLGASCLSILPKLRHLNLSSNRCVAMLARPSLLPLCIRC
jgi:Leucine-rich repeat (LRR) protein